MPDDDVRCSRCRRPFTKEDYVASISGRIMGDECTDVWYWCGACAVYTIGLYRDVFVGPETKRESAPIPRGEGDRRLEQIRSCPEPYAGRCRCQGHRAYFGEWLD